MDFEKCQSIYYAGIFLSLLISIILTFLSWGNWLLFSIGMVSTLVSLWGVFESFRGGADNSDFPFWLLWYLLPASIMLLGQFQILSNFQEKIAISTGNGQIKSLIPSANYLGEACIYFVNLFIGPIAWIIAVLARKLKWC